MLRLRRPIAQRREAGQAAVEAALTLPLTVFMVLGTLQLFMMLQGRILAEYAAFRAVRVGSVHHGDCTAMTHASIVALMPSYLSYLGPKTAGATPGQKLANAFAVRKNNRYVAAQDSGHDRAIVWIIREQPGADTVPDPEDRDFDQPTDANGPPNLMRLEIRLVYWYPMRIPFADWLMARMFLAQYGLMDYGAQNALMLSQTANWKAQGPVPPTLSAAIQTEMRTRYLAKQYVFPVFASSTMRMMTPAKSKYFGTQNCPPAPETL